MAKRNTRAEAMKVAARFGFVLDESVTGQIDLYFNVTFDHPTHSIGGDCRSITCGSYPGADASGVRQTASSLAWAEAIERMEDEGPLLIECTDHDCDYHFEVEPA